MVSPDRRRFLGTVAAGVVGIAVGAGLGWSLRLPETKEVKVTYTVPGPTVTVTREGQTVTREVTAKRTLPKDTIKIVSSV